MTGLNRMMVIMNTTSRMMSVAIMALERRMIVETVLDASLACR